MKKMIALLCAVTMTISFSGCSGSGNNNSGENTNQPENTPNNEIGEDDSNPIVLGESIEGEITVSCYETVFYKDFLENTAKAFEQKYPGTKVNIDSPSELANVKSSESDEGKVVSIEAEEDTQGQSDYISKINTALMSGGGADIYAMDVIPYYKYAENGQLEDLTQYMNSDPDFNMSDYKSNILDATKYNNGHYIFPLDYSFDYYEYDSSLLNESSISRLNATNSFTLDQLMEIAEESHESASEILGVKGYINPAAGTSMFNELFMNNYSEFVDISNRKSNFTDGTFAQMLDTIKDWEDKGYILSSNSASLSVEDFSTATDLEYPLKLKSNIELLLGHLRTLEGWNISIPLAGVTPSTTENDTIAGLSKSADGSVRFDYSQAYGINSNSENKQLAWEFIKFMASQEIQETLQLYPGSLTGLPIHNEARNIKALDGISGELFIQSGEPVNRSEMTADQQAALEEYISTVETYSNMLNTHPITDTTINTIINAEVQNFFDGKATSEEAASAIQSKVDMYLNE